MATLCLPVCETSSPPSPLAPSLDFEEATRSPELLDAPVQELAANTDIEPVPDATNHLANAAGGGNDDDPPDEIAVASDDNDDNADARPLPPGVSLQVGEIVSDQEMTALSNLALTIDKIKRHEAGLDGELFEAGRLTAHLMDDLGWTLKKIAATLNFSDSRLSQLRSNYLAFPTPESRLGQNFSVCFEARKAHQRLPKAEKEKRSPTELLKTIKEQGLTTTRKVSAHVHQTALKEAKEAARIKYQEEVANNPETRGTMFNDDCLNVLDQLADQSIKLIFSDPPYAQFFKVGHEGYESGRESTSGLRIDCANNNAAAAVPLTIEVIKRARRVVRNDGCMVLWSAGMHEDRPEFILAAREVGWRVGFAGYWKKRLTQPCSFDWPWTTCVERFLVLYPVGGAEPFDHSQELSRSDVITPDDLDALASFPSPSQMAHADFKAGRKNIGDVHMFQKSVALCRYFVEKLTYPGDVVLDLFGCSGDMCIAAEQADRRWIYCELDKDNFEWGAGRINDAVRNKPKPPAPQPPFEGDPELPF